MDDAQRPVAGRDVADHDAEAIDVRKLLEGERLRLHLAEDRIGLLLASLDHCIQQAVGDQEVAQLILDLGDQALVARGKLRQALRHRLVGFGIEVAEGQVLELVAKVLHAHAACERRIDVHGLFGNACPLFRVHVLQGTHVVQAVRELDQQHAHVVGDCQQQLAQVFRLLGLLADEIKSLELRQTLDEAADVFAKQLVDLGAGRRGILDRVVQQGHRNRRLVEMHVGEDGGHLERVRNVGIAAGALLQAMLLHGIDIGLVEESFIGIGLVLLNPFNKLVLPHHAETIPDLKNEKGAPVADWRSHHNPSKLFRTGQ